VTEFLLHDRPDLGGGHQEAGRERLGKLLPGMVEGDHLVYEHVGILDERPLVPVLEVMGVFVGGGEGLGAFEALEDGRGGGVEAFGPFEGVAPKQDVEGALFLLEEGAEVFLEVGGDLVQGGLGVRKWGNVLKI